MIRMMLDQEEVMSSLHAFFSTRKKEGYVTYDIRHELPTAGAHLAGS